MWAPVNFEDGFVVRAISQQLNMCLMCMHISIMCEHVSYLCAGILGVAARAGSAGQGPRTLPSPHKGKGRAAAQTMASFRTLVLSVSDVLLRYMTVFRSMVGAKQPAFIAWDPCLCMLSTMLWPQGIYKQSECSRFMCERIESYCSEHVKACCNTCSVSAPCTVYT